MSRSALTARVCHPQPLQPAKDRLNKTAPALQHMAGFTYIEVIVATALVVISLLPAMNALSIGVKGSTIHENYTLDHYYLTSRMEELLAEPYDDLDAEALTVNDPNLPTSYSEVLPPLGGRTLNRQVYLSRYDADNADNDDDFFTGTDDGLLWIRVELEDTGRSLERLTHAYD